jgi:hypothetical protein
VEDRVSLAVILIVAAGFVVAGASIVVAGSSVGWGMIGAGALLIYLQHAPR